MAEREGFEPPVPFRVQRFSRPPVSTTHAPLQHSFYAESGGLLQTRASPLSVLQSRHPEVADASSLGPASVANAPGSAGGFFARSVFSTRARGPSGHPPAAGKRTGVQLEEPAPGGRASVRPEPSVVGS